MNTPNLSALPLFEGQELRTIADKTMGLIYHGDDSGKILGYSNTRDAIARHCRAEGVVKRDTLTKGGKQSQTYITEANLLRLIAGSKLPNAEAFERWVFEELVPTVLKTGEYRAPGLPERAPRGIGMTDKTRAILLIGRELKRDWPTARQEVIATWTLDRIKTDIGIDTEGLRLALPSVKGEEIEQLNATQVGKLCGLSAVEVNKRLVAIGYQRKQAKSGYEVIGDGVKHGAMYTFTNNGHSGLEARWKSSVAEVLRSGALAGAKLNLFKD